MTDLDDGELRALIDASFGDGPPHPALGPVVAAGRRAVRRRVAAVGGLLVAGLALALGLSTIDGEPTRVVDPMPTPPASPERVTVSTDGVVDDGDLAAISGVHAWALPRGVEMERSIDNPLRRSAPAWSVALELREDGETSWLIMSTDGSGLLGRPGDASSFDAWAAQMGILESSPGNADPTRTSDDEDLVRVDARGDVVLLEGVTQLERVDGPGATMSALAVEFDGRTRWLAVYWPPGDERGWSVEGVFADEQQGRSFDDFVALTSGTR